MFALPDTRAMSLSDSRGLLIALPVICVMSMLAYLVKTGKLHFRGNLSRPPRLRREHDKYRIRAALLVRANKLAISPLRIPAAW